MAETKKRQECPKSDILTASPPGSPSWGRRYPVGSVVFESHTSSPAGSPTDDDKHSPYTVPVCLDEFKGSKEPVWVMGTELDHSIDITDCSPNLSMSHPIDICENSPLAKYSTRSMGMNNSQTTVSQRTNKPMTRMVLRCGKSKKSAIGTELASGKPDVSERTGRRIVSLTGHPLKCYEPSRCEGDAEDLDLENKIRSVLSQRNRRKTPAKPTAKSVRWDPAIISCGERLPSMHSSSEIEKDHRTELIPVVHVRSAIAKDSRPKSTQIAQSNPEIQKDGTGLNECIQTIVSLKRNERFKLQILLDALGKFDSGPTKLNPCAPEFLLRNRPNELNDSETLPIHETPQTRTCVPPTWIRTTEPFVQMVSTIDILELGEGYREAKNVNPVLARSILEQFTARYPMTGKVQPAPMSPTKGRLAAAIQQRLEYLLYQVKEQKAAEGLQTAETEKSAG